MCTAGNRWLIAEAKENHFLVRGGFRNFSMEKILPRSGTVVVSVGLRVWGDVKHELKAAAFTPSLKSIRHCSVMLCYVLIFLEVSGALQLTTRGVSREVLMFFIVQELFLYRKYKWTSHLYRLKTSRSKSIVAKKVVLIIFLLRASCVAIPRHKSSTQFWAIFFSWLTVLTDWWLSTK